MTGTDEILEDGCEVDGRSGSDSLGVVALLEQSVDSADGELMGAVGAEGWRSV